LSALGRFADGLLQTFEDRRPGLSDSTIAHGPVAVERFFLEIYKEERTRLDECIKLQEPHLADETREKFQREIDTLIRTVLIPAYVRNALTFTTKERNDFYLTKENLHLLERGGWALGGMVLGYLAIWAPFIPIWEKEWVLPFVIFGFLFPNIRRYWQFRRYERELNQLVARTDREISRIDIHYLTSGEAMAEIEALSREPLDQGANQGAVEARLERDKEQ
jgi:hypothetical protein